ncbi:MAG: hypothetical protein ACF8PN_06660 [Phycisphaerales bacterium]
MSIQFLSIANFTVTAAPGGADADSPGLIAWPLLALVILTLGGLFLIVVLTAGARMRRRSESSRSTHRDGEAVDPWTESGRRAAPPTSRQGRPSSRSDDEDAVS